MEQAIADVRARIESAAQKADRDPQTVTLLAVSKTHPPEVVRAAMDAGLSRFGENRVQEAQRKFDQVSGAGVGAGDAFELRLIGHLQRNKCRFVPGLFDWVESVDSIKLARALSARLEADGAECQVLLQYNSSGEDSKSGFESAELLLDASNEIARLPGLSVRGVMTIGPFVEDEQRIRSSFAATRSVFLRLQDRLGGAGVDTLSMGMTHDFELAIEEGSTEVRIGSALFGERGAYA